MFKIDCISIDYGKSKRLRIILEGESMINTSLAILLFNKIKDFAFEQQKWNSL